MEAPDQVRRFLSERHPEVLKLSLWVRQLVLDAEPDLGERIYEGWDGIGFRHPDAGYVCAIYPRGEEVRLLFEYGARLEDPDGLLEGKGSQTRYVSVREADAGLAPTLASYVTEAVAQRLFGR